MPRVLYVEDNADNRVLVRRILMAADTTLDDPFDVQEADSAQKGIELARATIDGAVWIGHVREAGERTLRLPAAP